jgi:predicted ATP-dependent protease
VQNALKIIFVEHIDEVMKIAFVQDEEDIRPPIPAVPISSQSVN